MNKHLIKLTIAVVLSLALTSCEKWIDESEFTYAIASTNFYNTTEEAGAAVMAPLDQMRDTYDANWFTLLEVNTEYCYPKGAYAGYGYNGFVNQTQEGRSAENWTSIYRAIMFCNTAISRLPLANAMAQEEIDAYLGELRFLRAFNYFNIVRHWGAAPLRTDTNIEQWNLPKSSADEIYAFIVADLQYAVDFCPDAPRLIGTPGKNAAKALLAEVDMYTQNYSEARDLAAEVINSNAYSLVNVTAARDFDKVFGYDLVTSTEEVFYIKTSRTDDRTWNYLSFTSHPLYEVEPGRKMLNGYGYFTHYTDLKNGVIANWDTNDLRYGLNVGFYVFGETAYGNTTALLTKYWDPNATGDGANVSIPLMRYSDVMITYAEANARVGGIPTAASIETLNQLRRRAYGYAPNVPKPELDYRLADYSTWDKFLDLLVREETYERMNEAKHWDFIVRLNKAQELIGRYKNLKGENTQITERHWLWKIPSAEFSYNKALDGRVDQNPGY